MEKRNFTIDSLANHIFEGFTNGETWNGWSCPFFEKDKALEIVEACNAAGSYAAFYDEETDSFVFESPGDDENEAYFAETLNGVKLYPVGSGVWIWEDAG